MKIKASYSTLCSTELLKQVVSQYKITNPKSCEFWYRGLNDTYKVISESGNFALRVYRKDWRTISDIEFEMEALLFLHKNGAKVAYPIEKKEGGYVATVVADEGDRQIIVTKFIEGTVLKYEDPQDAVAYGKAAAEIHICSNEFKSNHSRYKLDVHHLIEEPFTYVKPFLVNRPNDLEFLNGLVEKLSHKLNLANDASLDYGFCHGDFHGYNAHDDSGEIVHFDFDCCGYGLRAYDLATFKWNSRHQKKENELWPRFLEGYVSKRDVSQLDLSNIELLVAVRDLWHLGLHTGNTKDLAKGWINEAYLDRRMSFLRDVSERIDAQASGDES